MPEIRICIGQSLTILKSGAGIYVGQQHQNQCYFSYLRHCWLGSVLSAVRVSVFTARSELRKVLFLAPSVRVFWLCMKYLRNR